MVPLFRSEQERWQRHDGITIVTRHAFARDFPHQKGDHVLFGGASTQGKTTLAFDLMEVLAKPTFPAYVPVAKPRDPVTDRRGAELGFRRVSEWPPPKKLNEYEMFGGKKPPGYIISPHFGNLHEDMFKCAELTEQVLMERYAAGADPKSTGGILVVDDTMLKSKVMGLDSIMVTILAMAAAMDLGLWTFFQKPTGSGNTAVWAIEQSKHLLISRTNDDQVLKRYTEIMGDKAPIAKAVLPTLEQFQFLYYNRDKGYLCIVGAN